MLPFMKDVLQIQLKIFRLFSSNNLKVLAVFPLTESGVVEINDNLKKKKAGL